MKGKNKTIIVLSAVFAVVVILVLTFYLVGKNKYADKFLPNTKINDINVAGITVDDAVSKLYNQSVPEDKINITKCDGTQLSIPLKDIDYKLDYSGRVEDIYNSQNRLIWFTALAEGENIAINATPSYSREKLEDFLKSVQWQNTKPKNADIEISDDGCKIINAQDGEYTDAESMMKFVADGIENGVFTFNESDNVKTIKPDITAYDLKPQFDKARKIYNMTITYDFDYTTEKLEGKDIVKWVSFKDGEITVDREKAMEYCEKLAEKYDTYDTERKFHATWQGDITVPTSSDAVYGWWIWQDKTCDRLIDFIKSGEDVKTDPVYYTIEDCWGDTDFSYVGLESGRSEKSDIGDTYCEVDLSSQHFWYYKDGELQYDCDIVSGQPVPSDRKTLPGVYKVWYKATGYTMKGRNSQGSWTSYSDYWTRVAIAGIGLHDTQARTAFGGTIYKRNGSHGCINMPLKGARFVYENVEMNTPVVMYY